MELGELRPIATTLLLPPAGPLLLALLGVALGLRKRVAGATIAAVGGALLWLLSCNAVAVLLARSLLPQFEPVSDAQLQSVQAVVVLGGGTRPEAPEWGAAQPSPMTLSRIRYGATLARRSGKPLAFSGGTGWGGWGESEGAVAARVLKEDFGVTPRWIESRSRDTRGNAQMTAALLAPERIRRIALVTDASHMARSVRNFRDAGFDVVPAPTVYVLPRSTPLLEWLPDEDGLASSRRVLREWLALRLT